MRHAYEIPEVTIRRPRAVTWVAGVSVLLAVLLIRHAWFLVSWGRFRLLAVLWAVYFAVTALQWGLSWLERPFTVDAAGRARLDRMRVTVSVPVFNEEPEVLDRVLYALFRQTRLPDRVEVVDDGSSVDYREVRDWWEEHHPARVRFTWVRQGNSGKKLAQARTFEGDLADVFVTLDSDTVLEARAIEEGLKPFADRRVNSVAGFELAWNHDSNLLTRLNSARQLVWQLVTCSSQNVAGGNVLINRGTFALYRGNMVRDVLPAYVGETFSGKPVRLGDDTFLTTMALCRGRAVQQPSAVCLAMYPENLSHHFRQWTRWMRGTTLRTFWRLRYLRVTSWAWMYSVISLWWYVASMGITVVLALEWPRSASYTEVMIAVGALWALVMGSRILVVRRSDQSLLGRLGAVAMSPLALFWVTAVLRFLRVYGTLTFLRQGWTTRDRVEVYAEAAEAAPSTRSARERAVRVPADTAVWRERQPAPPRPVPPGQAPEPRRPERPPREPRHRSRRPVRARPHRGRIIGVALVAGQLAVAAAGGLYEFPLQTVMALILAATAFNMVVGPLETRWRLYAWRNPEAARDLAWPEPVAPGAARLRFSLIVPALDEADVIEATLRGLARQRHPHYEVIVSLCRSDTATLDVAQRVAKDYPRLITVVAEEYPKPSKARQLNTALRVCTGDVVGVIDAEDDVAAALLLHVEALFMKSGRDVVQGGVQLINLGDRPRKWFQVHNVLEYFFWFTSRMAYQANTGFVPLGGNTVFVYRELLNKAGGWPLSLTEDCALGVLLCTEFGATVATAYSAELSTREEAPPTIFSKQLGGLFWQRDRWVRGFLAELLGGTWLAMPHWRQRFHAGYILATPLVQGISFVLVPLAIITALTVKTPIVITMLTFAPFIPMSVTMLAQLAGLREFSRAYHRRASIWHYASLLCLTPLYQLLLLGAAAMAGYKYAKGDDRW